MKFICVKCFVGVEVWIWEVCCMGQGCLDRIDGVVRCVPVGKGYVG